MADASDSKSDAGNSMWVQVPFPALNIKNGKPTIQRLFGLFFLVYIKFQSLCFSV